MIWVLSRSQTLWPVTRWIKPYETGSFAISFSEGGQATCPPPQSWPGTGSVSAPLAPGAGSEHPDFGGVESLNVTAFCASGRP